MKRGHALTAIVTVVSVSSVAAISLWFQGHYLSVEPAKVVGNALIDAGFCATALLLFNQPGQRVNAMLAALVSLTSFAGNALSRDLGLAAPFAYVAMSFTQVLGGILILRYPSSRLDRWVRLWAGCNLTLAGLFGVAMMLADTPAWWSRVDLGNSWPHPWLNLDLNSHIMLVRSCWRVLLAASFLWLLVRRYRRLPRLERHTLMPIAWGAAFSAVVIATDLAQWWIPPALTEDLQVVRSYIGAVIAGAFVWSALRLRMTSTRMTHLVADLSGVTTLASVRTALQRALDDDSLDIVYWLGDRETYVDDEGNPQSTAVARPTDRILLEVPDSHGAPLAVISADGNLYRHTELVRAAASVSALALENARLQAGLQAQLQEMKEARTRLLNTGLTQRRQLERDLHDGAQQRLLALGMRLAVIESEAENPATQRGIRAAQAELGDAIAELRDLAHGIYPAVLSQGGLAPALETVAERSPIEVDLDIPYRRWPANVENVAYMVVCEALTNAVKHANTSWAAVRVSESPDHELVTVVSDHGRGWDPAAGPPTLSDLTDRLGALGGRLAISTSSSGTEITARIPLPLLDL